MPEAVPDGDTMSCAETGNESRTAIGQAVRLPYELFQAERDKDCRDAIAFIQPDRVLTVYQRRLMLAGEQALREAGIELSDLSVAMKKARERMKSTI